MKKEKSGGGREENLHDLLLNQSYLDAVRSLAAGVTHNYNNIFGGLLGQFALLRRDDLAAEEREATLGLIDELLQRGTAISARLSPFIKKKMDSIGTVAPVILVQEAAELLGLLSSSHRIVPTADPNLPPIRCVPRWLLLALFHLGRNAIEAMPGGGTVNIEAERGDDRFDPLPSVVFSVSDHGRGIPEECRERLFEPFPSSKQFCQSQAFGLGLYAVRNFASLLQGTIEYDTEMDRGSTFRLILPAAPPQVKEVAGADREPAQAAPAKAATVPEIGGPLVILVVEDEEPLRLLITRFLQNTGNVVFSVQDGREAIEEYSDLHETINTVVMDAGLPDMTGQQCVKRLMEIEPELTIVYMTGDHLEGDELYPPGASLLFKPFTENDLYRAIGNARKRKSTQLS